MLKLLENHGSKAVRQRAIRKAEQWMLERTKHTDGLAAIYPPMMYVIMALDLLGYPQDHPERVEAQTAVRPAAGGRRARLLLPAVFFSGLGYRQSRRMRWANRPSLPPGSFDASAPTGC